MAYVECTDHMDHVNKHLNMVFNYKGLNILIMSNYNTMHSMEITLRRRGRYYAKNVLAMVIDDIKKNSTKILNLDIDLTCCEAILMFYICRYVIYGERICVDIRTTFGGMLNSGYSYMCISCKGEGKIKCDRCGAPYCSTKCRYNDKRKHKVDCDKITSANSALSINSMDKDFDIISKYPYVKMIDTNNTVVPPAILSVESDPCSCSSRLGQTSQISKPRAWK